MSLDDWLGAHRLGHLGDRLHSAGVDLDVLPDLSDEDLSGLGILLGDRKRLLKAVAEGLQGLQAPMPEAPRPAPGFAPSTPQQGAASPTMPGAAEGAERRQLTVMFCDLVDSTRLSEQLDPEDLRDVIQIYYEAVSAAVSAFGGHVEQYLGDGVLVFFGYPRAMEDAVTRAVSAALAVVDAVCSLEPMPGLRLRCRIGIATGPVVLGALMSESGTVVTGRTPNLAARLQGFAEPGQVLLAPETARLAGTAFRLQRLPSVAFKGIDGEISPWRVLGEHAPESRWGESRQPGSLIGREAEAALLMQRWSLACESEPQAILLSGEAGIGKSRLSEALVEHVRASGGQVVVWQCSPHFAHSALWPVARQLERLAGIDASDDAAQRIQKLARAGIASPHLQQLTGAQDSAPTADPVARKLQTEDAVLEVLRELARSAPLLLLLEDAHWIDPSTQGLLQRSLAELGTVPLLLLLNSRPENLELWEGATNLTRLSLNRLGQRQSMALVEQACKGQVLPPSIVAEIIRKTDGVPLYVEELTRAVIESGEPGLGESHSVFDGLSPELAVPASLQDSLMARLDRLSVTKEIAQVGAVVGREFGHRLLAAILEPMSSDQLDAALADLLRSELVSRRGSGDDAVYVFKHALVRDTAYNSLLRVRRTLWHAKVARALQKLEPGTVAQRPEFLAYHLQEAGEHADAGVYWNRAAEAAFARAALPEAARHVQSAIALVKHSPDAVREEQRLQTLLIHVMTQLEGYGSVRGVSAGHRAVELARQLGDTDLHVEAACGLGTLLVSSGLIRETVELFDAIDTAQLVSLAPERRAARHWVLGASALLSGSYTDAVFELERALDAIREPETPAPGFFLGGAAPEVAILLWCERALELTGRLERARSCSERAYAIALQDSHAPTLTWSLQSRAAALMNEGSFDEARPLVRQLLDVSRRFGIKQRVAAGLVLEGQLALVDGRLEDAREKMKEGFGMWVASAPGLIITNYAALAARSLEMAGDIEGASFFLAAGERAMEQTQECSASAELQRVRARVAQRLGRHDEARACLEAALETAERQGARIFALRACIDRHQLDGQTQERDDVLADLRRVYSGFTEGFDTALLRDARRILDAFPS